MEKALEGIRVLDLSQFLSGPFCTMNLADFGAEVIKIERPGAGEGSRAFGPFKNGQSGYYTLVNRGKKSVTLDLKKGQEILYKMVMDCDVLVENFKPGVMESLGYSYECLHAINPRLIYCAISGFGQTGPLRTLRSYDVVAQGMSGLMSITGYPDGQPARAGCSVGDLSASMYALSGILMALYQREKTGEGQLIDISMLDSTFAFLETNVVRYTIGGECPKRVGARHPLSAPFDVYRCKGGAVVIAIASNNHFAALCRLIGQPALIQDAKFDEDCHRSANDAELKQIIERALMDCTSEECLRLLRAEGIPCGPLNSVEEACENQSLLLRDMLVEIDQPGMGRVKITGNPIKMSATPPNPAHPAPGLGENTQEVLRKTFGFSEEALRRWQSENVF